MRTPLETKTAVALRSHVDTEPQVRRRKAQKVAAILQRLAPLGSGELVLDLGCGAGFIAAHLRRIGCSVVALDMADHRTRPGSDFILGRVENLPFPSDTFSIVVSNQVIEHVVDAAVHLREIRRVLAPSGIAYVATPNRFAVLEPHYRLPFLSWLPRRLAHAYVRIVRRGTAYDVLPLTRSRLLHEAGRAGLECQDVTPWMIAETAAVEGSPLARLAGALPEGVLHQLSWLSPSFVFLMRRMEVDH